MFRREIKKQFNENKYNILTQKGRVLLYLVDKTNNRCTSKISAIKVSIPKTLDWINSIDDFRIQLHQEILHIPSFPQGSNKTYAFAKWGTTSFRKSTNSKDSYSKHQ